MALKVSTSTYKPKVTVSTKPNYTGTLKVGSGSTAKISGKIQGSSYNPQPAKPVQKTAPRSYFQSTAKPQNTYNPQKASKTAQEIEAERRHAVELAKRIQLKKMQDALNKSISETKTGWLDKLTKNRENYSQRLADKYLTQNQFIFKALEDEVSLFEKEMAKRQNELMTYSNYKNAQEWEKAVADYNKWVQEKSEDIQRRSNEYNIAQLELQSGRDRARSDVVSSNWGKVKAMPSAMAGTAFSAFVNIAQTSERAVNTGLNFVNPNRLRMYYGGDEKKGGLTGGSNLDQLKASWNASKEQRLLGHSKESEQAKLKYIDDAYARRAGGKNMFGGSPNSGFFKALEKGFVKYGDDVVNLAVDPMNYIPGGQISKINKFSKGQKAVKWTNNINDRLLAIAGKNKFTRDFVLSRGAKDIYKQSTGKSIRKWLGSNKGEYYTDVTRNFFDNRLPKYQKTASDFDKGISKNWRSMQLGKAKRSDLAFDIKPLQKVFDQTQDYYKTGWLRKLENLQNKSGKEGQKIIDAIQQYRAYYNWADDGRTYMDKKAMSWDKLDDLTKGLSDTQRRTVEKYARKMQVSYDKLWDSQKAIAPDFKYRAGYNPRWAKESDNFFKYKDKTKSAGTPWWAKEQTDTRKMSNDEFVTGARKRVLGQFIQENPEDLPKLFKLRKMDKNLAELNSKYFGKIQKAKALKNKELRGQLDGFERLVGNRPIAPDPSPLLTAEKNVDNWGHRFGPLNWAKKAVTLANPAWYSVNAGSNMIMGGLGGGLGAWGDYGKAIKSMIKERTFHPKMFQNLPDGVVNKLEDLLGATGKGVRSTPAVAIENTARYSMYNNFIKKGLKHDEALRKTNDWLFDYSLKNWERPISKVFPFWLWSKNLNKNIAKMPFEYPKQANLVSEFYKQAYERPLNELPEEDRKYYQGKIKVGNTWVNTPMNPLTPEVAGRFATNPYMNALSDTRSNVGYFGQSLRGASFGTNLANSFPQVQGYNLWKSRNDENWNKWFTKSGYGKATQGQNPDASNYDRDLDSQDKFSRWLGGFLGMPKWTTRDPEKTDRYKRLTDFNNDFFSVDWDKRLEELLAEDKSSAYDRLNKEKADVATKYGFDIEKDIYKGEWSKYDTEVASNTKRLKEEARAFNDAYWDEYSRVPKSKKITTDWGSYYERSKKRPFWIDKFKEWDANDTFAENPYYRIPQFSKENSQYGQINPYEYRAKEAELDAKSKQRADKKAQWQKYWSSSVEASRAKSGYTRKSSPYQFDGKYFKSQETMDKYKEGKFWRDYYATNDFAKREQMLNDNPQYRKYEKPETLDEWIAFKRKKKADDKAKAFSNSDTQKDYDYWVRTINDRLPNRSSGRKVKWKVAVR